MREKLISAFSNLADSAIAAAPKVLVGIVLIVIGLLVAKIIEIILRFILTRIRFDHLMEKAGIDKTLHRIGLRQQLNLVIPRLVYFLHADCSGAHGFRRARFDGYLGSHWRIFCLLA